MGDENEGAAMRWTASQRSNWHSYDGTLYRDRLVWSERHAGFVLQAVQITPRRAEWQLIDHLALDMRAVGGVEVTLERAQRRAEAVADALTRAL